MGESTEFRKKSWCNGY